MGTKLNPGKFDCYTKAADDEPMFVLLARDPLAPHLVKLWAAFYPASRAQEAMECADEMTRWYEKNILPKQGMA